MLKETTGDLDGDRTHDLHITSQNCPLILLFINLKNNNYGVYYKLQQKHTFSILALLSLLTGKFKLYLFYNDYETSYTTYINHARWHRCLRTDGLRVGSTD